ncbi:AAA family ATPase [Promicromonospora thailandica]|uniref:AAA domain-containing protein n=1 Tax=Promicromonospora thailandica TaxID=765201 RepID=A0A9X2K0Q3_9MICO|nr:AAA family ATPase [Promicromonospora thailandica]MCP2267304.1 AAA domain-containing protein [Promicromonospora thailandica]BFF20838.1 ATP-binding protein [Promicromonospora thailandica]
MSPRTSTDHTPRLLLVTGPPGSGKSTVTAALADLWEPSVLVEGDAFFAFLRRGAISPWLPESHAQNDTTTRAAAAAAGTFAAGGMVVVYDGVVGPWFLPGFAAATGVDVLDYVVLLPPVETCLHRVATRAGHGFTDLDAARHMHEDFVRATADGAPGAVLRDPPADVPGVVDAVRDALRSGRSRYAVAG